MKKIILLTAVVLLIIFSTYVVQGYNSAVVENEVSFSIGNPDSMISFVHEAPFSIRQGTSHHGALIVTNLMNVPISYRLEHSSFDFTLAPSEGSLSPGQSESVSIAINESGTIGPTYLDVYLYADFDGGNAKLKTTLLANIE